ncbi:L-threonylcarbamoyladenylate synthase [Novispirillum itersonii]|uniref:Threonylcarbamoyl-AMP synthase n=1 Tax=Novispirillum itersonii TaxID=189 RepID=A0A7W9ZH35_NOVIT|nr:L-threonylcarbamoyladenylate synthase [Novispirillum itersonii]MBB6210943.1 L-threonylcarbamoyladenylate synthase [Novispirillum itersonii]
MGAAVVKAASPAVLEEAAALLRDGRLVAFPTETVYGLGANARIDTAVAGIFAAKGRPHFNPLIVHVPDMPAALELAEFDDRARRVAARFWPGPLTLVLPRRADSGLSHLVSAGLPSVALRMPAHPLAQDLLRRAGCPVAAPSANRSGSISPTQAAHVANSLGDRVDLIVDGGSCAVGVESTVIDLTTPQAALLRPGGIAREDLEAELGPLVLSTDAEDAPKSPGQLLSHYAPSCPVRLLAERAEPGEALLGFGGTAGAVLDLSPGGNLLEAAANLFAMLHRLDAEGWQGIAVAPVPDVGLGLAINDRLRRAAAPRG